MGAKKPNPRYNHVQTRLSDDTYDAMRRFAKKNEVSYCHAAESLIVAALIMTGELKHDCR